MTTALSVLVCGPDLICVYSEVFILRVMAFERCTATFEETDHTNHHMAHLGIVLQASD
jgi:hypothetical protein